MFGKKKKILVVDDEPDVLNLIKCRLELDKYNVIIANNGEEGLFKAYSERPDLILLDVIMPGRSGYEVCRDLKDNEVTRDIPVILLTAKGRQDDVLEGSFVGCDAYITKPYDPKVLLSKVKKLLSK